MTRTHSTIDYTRQRDWFNPNGAGVTSATIIGCGGIGGFASFALAKLGIQRLRLLDLDTVDDVNIPNQMFSLDHLGQPKAEALASQLLAINPDLDIETTVGDLADGFKLSDVVIAAVDSMAAREAIWKQTKLKAATRLLLDGRLSGQRIVLYSVNPVSMEDIRGYESTLYSDDEADEGSCTAKSIIDVGFAIGSMMARAVRMHYANVAPIPLVYLDQENLDLFKGGWDCR